MAMKRILSLAAGLALAVLTLATPLATPLAAETPRVAGQGVAWPRDSRDIKADPAARYGRPAHGTRYTLAKKRAKGRGHAEIGESGRVESGWGRGARTLRHVVRFDFVEVSRQAMTAALWIAHQLAWPQQGPQLVIEIEGIDDLENLNLRFTHSN